MIKTIFSVILILSTLSCATVREYQATYREELAARDEKLFGKQVTNVSWLDDPTLGLLLGLYAFSLAENPPKYPIYPYSPYLFSPFYPYGSFHDLMVYESMLESINLMETSKLQFEVQRIIDELERAAEDAEYELESAEDDLEETTERLEEAARKLENERWNSKIKESYDFLNEWQPRSEPSAAQEKAAQDHDLSWLDEIPPKKDKAEFPLRIGLAARAEPGVGTKGKAELSITTYLPFKEKAKDKLKDSNKKAKPKNLIND